MKKIVSYLSLLKRDSLKADILYLVKTLINYWEFNDNKCKLIFQKNRSINLKGSPKQNIEKIIEDFNFDIPKELPPISSILSGYFSYDIIRYIEKFQTAQKMI